jgi:hypothetical protein
VRVLISSAIFGLLPVPLGPKTYGDERERYHCVKNDVQYSYSAQLSPENTLTMASAELARLRSEFGINIGARSKRRRARYQILGKGWGAERIHLLLNYENEVEAKARQLAAMPGQSPVAVIDTSDCGAVTFYFADGHVCLVVRKTRRSRH